MDRRTFLAGTAGVAAVGLAGCMRSGGADDGDFDIGMGASFFRPDELEAEVGTTVVWRNTGSRHHTVTAYEDGIPDEAEYFASGGFDSEEAAREAWMDDFGGRIAAGEEFEHTFDVSGTYNYVCIPHEPSAMVGQIVVTE